MMNLKLLLKKLSAPVSKHAGWIFAALALVGLSDASYLTAKHYLGTPINCSIFGDCDKVTTSAYSAIWGIPVALFGAIYYIFIFLLAIWYLDSKKESILYFIASATAVGFLASVWFLYLQLFVIGALCLYCIISAITSTLLFITGLIVLKYRETN